MSRRLATPTAVLLLSALIAFTALAGGATRPEDCRGNSPKKPCPTIEPGEGATVRGTVRVRATIEQANADVAGILFELDGTPLGAEDTVAPYELDWDTTKTPNGGHSLTATVRLGNGDTSTGRNDLSVDNPTPDTTAPTAQVTSPSSGSTVSGSIEVTANASDNVGVVGVQFKLDGANLGAEDTSAPYGVTWDTKTSSNAQHTLTAVARDAAGNKTTTSSTTVTVSNTTSSSDTTPPSAQLTAPTAGSSVSSSVHVTANATDNVGVVGVQFKLDGANLGAEDTTSPYVVGWDTTKSTNAQHTLTAVARDAAGNKTTTSSTTVSVTNSTTVTSSGSLRWPAPTLTSPQTITIPERGGETWNLEAGKDYIIRFETGRRYGPLGFTGGRNLVLVGGEQIIDDTSSTDYRKRRLLVFRNQTGTIHIEGYLGTGPGLTEGINIWAPDAVLQIQKSRIENLHRMDDAANLNHPDLIQTWSGPREVRIWRFSGWTDYQGFLFSRDTGGVYPSKVTIEDVNIRPLPNPAWGGKGYGIAAMWLLSASIEFRFGGVWVETGWWNGTYHKGLKGSLGYRDPDASAPLWSWQEFRADGTAYGPEVIAQPASYGDSYTSNQGDSLEFVRPSTDNIWNLERSGRTRIYQGVPPGGDYVAASTVGRGYQP